MFWGNESMPEDLQELIDRKMTEREIGHKALLEFVHSHPEDVPSAAEQSRIQELTAMEIVAEIKNGKVRAVEAMVSFCLRAMEAGKQFNATADEMFMEGIQKAKEADTKLAKEGAESQGPLFGLPVSIKDHIDVIGTDSTSGIPDRLFDPASKNALVAQALIDAGAIPYVKGNIPMSLMTIESPNSIFGRALNPWNVAFTPGGSSGGEGALVACGAAPLGIGTDIGGSIRQPCAFNLLFGFKPTPMRLSLKGVTAPGEGRKDGQKAIVPTSGPLARSAKDVALVMQVLLAKDSVVFQDPYLPPVPLRDLRAPPPRMRIGFFLEDGWFESSPGGKRAVREAKSLLEKAGHEVVPFEVPKPFEFPRIFFSLLTAEGGLRNIKSGIGRAPFLKEYAPLEQASKIPNVLRPAIAAVLELLGEKRQAHLARTGGTKTTFEYQQLIKEADEYCGEFIQSMDDKGIDVLLCPAGNFAGLKHGESGELSVAISMTFLFNLLHFPAGVVPVTLHRKDEEKLDGSKFNDKWKSLFEKSLEGTAGLPACVQLAAKPFRDELVLELMLELEPMLTKQKYPFVISKV